MLSIKRRFNLRKSLRTNQQPVSKSTLTIVIEILVVHLTLIVNNNRVLNGNYRLAISMHL